MAIQIPDKPNDDLSLIRCYAFNEPNLSMNDFVIIEDSTSHQAGQNNKGYLAFYEVPPLNSLRLYLKIVGVLPLNVFDLDLYRIDLPPF